MVTEALSISPGIGGFIFDIFIVPPVMFGQFFRILFFIRPTTCSKSFDGCIISSLIHSYNCP